MKVLRKIYTILLVGFVIISPAAANGSAESDSSEISGIIEGGLRLLDVGSSDNNLEYTIYRGDYIVFNFENGGSHDFTVPGLEIDTVMPRPESEKPYVKMKKSGDYDFTLGNKKGTFHVLELVDSHYHELTAAEAVELINNVNPVIIDVRTSGEYEGGHIPGANLLPVQVFEDNLAKLEQFKEDDILLYCASGNRSTVASRMLIDAGFSRVYNLRHGIGDWARKGYPVE